MPPHPREELRIISRMAKNYSPVCGTYYQIHCRRGISLRVYQNPVMRVNPLILFCYLDCIAGDLGLTHGVTAASNMPIKTEMSRQSLYVRHG